MESYYDSLKGVNDAWTWTDPDRQRINFIAANGSMVFRPMHRAF
ncbi:hypothetical protein [Paenibacillus mesophilus]|nr:hypothetical protein [Paenibacillus mesophilus]